MTNPGEFRVVNVTRGTVIGDVVGTGSSRLPGGRREQYAGRR